MKLSSGKKLKSPNGIVARPTTSRVRAAIANKLKTTLFNARWLDLFCGTGVMSCEALEQGANSIVAVDRNHHLIQTAQTNLEMVQANISHSASIAIHQAEVLNWLEKQVEKIKAFDLIYMDPPYKSKIYDVTLDRIASNRWLNPNGLLIVECAKSNFPKENNDWKLVEQCSYGSTTILYLHLKEHCHDGIDSRQQQRVR
uniref:Methyltransferase n=1 Tax=Paulinella chromatophora TaxID=39717 RepID=B1X5G7_PAUCH|nr:hypothetical protein PCC_0771 [Paulinella chromatophora]ACB43186.1 hypothetical protein PCC_0771 [Paulinella chromatophora]